MDRLFKGPLNSSKNIQAFIHSLETRFGDEFAPRVSDTELENSITYGDWIYNPDNPSAVCPEREPCVGCSGSPTPTPTSTITPTPTISLTPTITSTPTTTLTVTPTITLTVTPTATYTSTPQPTVTSTPDSTPLVTPSSSYYVGLSIKMIP